MSTLANIRSKVRRLTKNPSPNQITDSEIDDYINTFYQYDFPEHLRLFNLKEKFAFITEPNIDIYNFTPNTFVTIEPPVYISGLGAQLYQSQELFFRDFPEIRANELLTTGTAAIGAGPYAGNTTAFPIKRNRVLISTVDVNGNAMSAIDSTTSTFVGDVVAGATINYLTGAIAAVTWTAAVGVGESIRIQSVSYAAAKPWAVLFFNDIFQLSPVPDQAYRVEMTTYRTPTSLINANDQPELNEWWQLLAYGASLKIFEDRLDTESFAKVRILFDEMLRLIERRTLKQISIQRVPTIYSSGRSNRFTSLNTNI